MHKLWGLEGSGSDKWFGPIHNGSHGGIGIARGRNQLSSYSGMKMKTKVKIIYVEQKRDKQGIQKVFEDRICQEVRQAINRWLYAAD